MLRQEEIMWISRGAQQLDNKLNCFIFYNLCNNMDVINKEKEDLK